ncbi:conserved hypothetical protein [Ricinus communis]|uniref:Uncharacterized protein n=1 Tax=Ricinus communis TaxID=3988 RepID=B9S379_RICCO|nr:conserved hypothetical protein [Ricinus communis]
MKEMHGAASKGCLNHLYDSIEDLDAEKYFKSNDHKEILLCPKIAPTFGYEHQLLRVDGLVHPQFYAWYCCYTELMFSIDRPAGGKAIALNVKDPKSPPRGTKTGGSGYVIGPAIFTVKDDLNVTPISPVSGVCVLNKLKVPFSDIEERTVDVGIEKVRYYDFSLD